jgi:hypothetical protein
MERAKKLKVFWFYSRAEVPNTDDFGLLLSVGEGRLMIELIGG